MYETDRYRVCKTKNLLEGLPEGVKDNTYGSHGHSHRRIRADPVNNI